MEESAEKTVKISPSALFVSGKGICGVNFSLYYIGGEKVCDIMRGVSVVGFSGFTPSGYPKEVPHAIVEHCKDLRFSVYTGSSVGSEIT